MNEKRWLLLILGLLLWVVPCARALDTGSQNELAWRASELAQALTDFERSVEPSQRLQRAIDTVREFQELIRKPETTLAETGNKVEAIIRTIRELDQATTSRNAAWSRVVDGLGNLQGQYESIRARAGAATSDGTVSERQALSELDIIVRALRRVEQRAPSVLRAIEGRELISYLRLRVEFVRDHKQKLSAPLLRREYLRLQEDAASVRTMLQQQPYDEELGAAWREARDRIAALTSAPL